MTEPSWPQTKFITSSSSSPKEATQVGLDKESVLGMIYENRPFILTTDQPITGEFAFDLSTATGTRTIPVIELAIENGNSCTRTMALHFFTHQAVITEIPSVYEEQASNLIYSAGEPGESWQIETPDGTRSALFHIGEYADNQQDLPIGPTFARWSDPRFIDFNRACIVRTLRAAGYGPGTHSLSVCPGARNEEVSVEKGVDSRVQEAFMKGLQSFVIWRNQVERYEIRIVEVTAAIPQTFGSHYAFDTDLMGRSLHPNVPMWNWFDIGFYDGHDVTVRRIGRNLRVSGVKVTDGMARMVREMEAYLRQPGNFPIMDPPSYAQALDMMRTGEVKIGGMPLDNLAEIERGRWLINTYKDKEGGQLIRTMMANHPNIDSVFAFTGGGTIDLAEQIKEQTGYRPKNLTKILPPEVARIANVAGIYWLLNLSKRKRSILRSSY